MNLVRWNPMKEIDTMRHRVQSIFDDFFPTYTTEGNGLTLRDWQPQVDIYEEDNTFVIKAALPGVEKDNISVDLNGRVLTIRGERSENKEIKEDNYYRKETAYGRFQRSFTLPDEVDEKTIKADYKDGILTVSVPKPVEHRPKKITVH